MEATTDQPKPWMKQPGELHDKRGIPIYPGDLLKSPHFIGARGKRHWLYHVAVMRDGAMFLVPPRHLITEEIKQGGSCMASQALVSESEIISGHGPGDCLGYEDRPRVRVETEKGTNP